MQTRIEMRGNDLVLRIPRSFADTTQLTDGSVVDLSVANGRLRVRPVRARRYRLSELLKGINRRNLRSEAFSL